MVITAVLGDSLPSQSNIAVIFNQLTWAREITPGHTLPIIPTMSCSAITVNPYIIVEYCLLSNLHWIHSFKLFSDLTKCN